VASLLRVSDQPPGHFYLVRLYDLRYDYPDLVRRGGRTLGARILLDQNLRLVAEAFGARSQRPDLLGVPKENGK
jgi:hypothetical protein